MSLFRKILFPFAILYDVVTSIRNVLFDKGVLKSTKFDTPLINVGNLSVGGTGKTPQIEYLVRLLKNQNKVAVLSRGYKRKSTGFVLADDSTLVQDIGDEPFQFYSKFDELIVAVDEQRVHGVQQLLSLKKAPDVILLDDAFQHRKVNSGFNILLTPYHDLYVDDLILPAGNLRESRRGSKRAQIVVVTKCPQSLSDSEKRLISNKLKLNSDQYLFFTTIAYSDEIVGPLGKLSLEKLKGYDVLLITGIANPKPLVDYLEETGINLTHLKYSDHHNFSESEIQNIQNQFGKMNSKHKLILTTEKDYMRLKNRLEIHFLGIEISFLEKGNKFNKLIEAYVSNS